jgi:hypothetical protein
VDLNYWISFYMETFIKKLAKPKKEIATGLFKGGHNWRRICCFCGELNAVPCDLHSTACPAVKQKALPFKPAR